MMQLEGKRVVVTGAGGSVGQSLCGLFAKAGATIIGCDMDQESVPGICKQRLGFDLRDDLAVADAAKALLADGPPDVVVSNAGWTRAETLAMTTVAAFDAEMGANFGGAAKLSLALLPAMRTHGEGGTFVFVASVNADAHYGNPAYSAAKAAVLAWVRAIATEAGRDGVRANAVVPASIQSNAWDHRLESDPDVIDRVSRLYPLGRLVTPDEVAQAALFLASPLSSGITGVALNVDAGLGAGNLPFLNAITNPET